MSCRAASECAAVSPRVYRRRKGSIKKPRFSIERGLSSESHIFGREVDSDMRAQGAGEAVIAYMDEIFVHQAHASVC